MFVLVRAATYATLFVGLVLVFVPARVLSWSGIAQPSEIGVAQVGGMMLAVTGAVVALWCVLTFALIGRGTPAPFDPPRRLVVRGPYGLVRNPMYMGAGLALVGAAILGISQQRYVNSHRCVLGYPSGCLSSLDPYFLPIQVHKKRACAA